MSETRVIKVDGVEIMTSLNAVEIAKACKLYPLIEQLRDKVNKVNEFIKSVQQHSTNSSYIDCADDIEEIIGG